MKFRKINPILTIIVGLIALLLVMNFASWFTKDKEGYTQVGSFIKEEQPIDVLFLGTSRARAAFQPMEIFHDFGIVSYNLSQSGESAGLWYWVYRLAIEQQKPKVVVLEIDTVGSDIKIELPAGVMYTHTAIDEFPMSTTKLQAIWDLTSEKERLEENELNQFQTRLEYLFTPERFHTRWTELSEADLNPEFEVGKGGKCKVGLETNDSPALISESLPLETLGMEYLDKLVTDAKSRGIEVVLTCLPTATGDETIMHANFIAEYAANHDIPYINFYDTNAVDFQTGMLDQGHVNKIGALSASYQIGQFLSENYELADNRTNPQYMQWIEQVDKYLAFKDNEIIDKKDLTKTLIASADKDYSFILYINDPTALFVGNEDICNLTQELSRYQELTEFKKICNDPDGFAYWGIPYVAIIDNAAATIYENPTDSISTNFGQVTIANEDSLKITIGDASDEPCIDETTGYDQSVFCITVINKHTNQVVCSKRFTTETIISGN